MSISTVFRFASAVCAALPALALHVASAQVTYGVIAELGSVGTHALGGVVKASNGALYGTTWNSANGCGTVYKVATDGDVSGIHAFSGADGCGPVGELVEGADGHLYGTTWRGGPNVDSFLGSGTGTVFRISMPDETFSMIHAFAAFDSVNGWYPEGFGPYGGLIVGPDNNLYGITNGGGTRLGGACPRGGGTVFRITPDGDLTVLHSLHADEDGCGANAGLSLGSDGNFYGTTAFGGGSSGSIFRVTPAGAFTKLFVFAQNPSCACWSDGFQPTSEPVRDGAGNLYGTASAGGPPGTGSGTVWKLSPSGALTVLKAFTGAGAGGTDGSFPFAGLTLGSDGNFYGTTNGGGAHGPGTAFRISPTGAHEVLHSFDQPTGAGPDGRLIEISPGVFVGTTQIGGTLGGGVVFRLAVPPANLQIKSISAPATTAVGSAITVKDTTRNIGTGPAGPSTTRIWLSANKTLGDDLELGTRSVGALAALAQQTGTTVVTVPTVAPGLYYLLVKADAENDVSESSETDNLRVKSLLIGPDLVIKTLTFTPSTPTSTSPTTIELTVNNAGGENAGPSVTRLYRSSNGKLDAADVLLAELPLGAVNAGQTLAQSTSVTLPAGTYYIIAVCDYFNAVAEAKETNNMKKAQKTVP